MKRNTWILALITAALIAVAILAAFDLNSLHWLGLASPPPTSAERALVTTPVAPMAAGPSPRYCAIVREVGSAVAGVLRSSRRDEQASAHLQGCVRYSEPKSVALLILRAGEKLYVPVELG